MMTRKTLLASKSQIKSGYRINEHAFQYYSCLQRLKEYVDTHYAERIPAPNAAKITNKHKKYFSAFFHQKVGITYTDWLMSIRVARAIAIIQSVDDSMTHVAYTTGFGDLRTFERAFKKITGLTPIEFKKCVRPS
jgi:two-component system response regulator YesN